VNEIELLEILHHIMMEDIDEMFRDPFLGELAFE
jgi:hypothetical protein